MDELNSHLRREAGEEDVDIDEHGRATDDILESGFLSGDDD
jgi:hypothetical protein